MLYSYLTYLQSSPGWFAINVLVPVLLPFAVIAAVASATGGWRDFVQMTKKAVDNGQLFWVALTMLASTGYEAFIAYGRQPELNEVASWVLGICITCGFFTSIFIAVNSSRFSERQRTRKKAVWISILLTLVLSYCYPLCHFIFSGGP